MKIKIIVGIVIGFIVVAGGYALVRQEGKNSTTTKDEAVKNMQKDETVAVNEAEKSTMQKEPNSIETDKIIKDSSDGMMEDKKIMEEKPGAYVDYLPQALSLATQNGGKAVLFFWASWCPYCKIANEDFTNNLSQIPKGVTVLKVNYDTEKELKTKYGVTYQHTFVQVNESGNQITKWNGGGIKELKANIK